MISSEHYEKNGYTGLCNLGNTCFLNSCMQILSNTHELHSLLYKPGFASKMDKKKLDTKIFNEFQGLTELMWSGNGVANPRNFVLTIHKVASKKGIEIFTGWAQNDVTEFLRFVVNSFHNSVARSVNVKIIINQELTTDHDKLGLNCLTMLRDIYKKEYSEVMDMFYGVLVSELASTENNQKIYSLKPEQYFILDLPIPNQQNSVPTLMDCFHEFIKPELLTGNDALIDDKTGEKKDALKRMRFWNFPKILVITLKRFNVSHNHISKNEALVNFPLTGLDLSSLAEDYQSNRYVYDLYGVSNHIGGINGGHYTAFVKRKDGKWIYFDDSNVAKVENPTQIVSSMAYCLFYRMV